jgi:hypothetical protein
MIKVDNVEVWGFEHAIRGMRNPMNSWEKSDSRQSDFTDDGKGGFVVGDSDLKLMKKLVKGGHPHRKFLRQIFVSMDITAPLYWWKEFDTYKVGTVANSCSTMHKLTEKEFELDDFSHEHLAISGEATLDIVVTELNRYRDLYLNGCRDLLECVLTLQPHDKRVWWQMIQLLPSSYNQKRTVTFNYENALNIIEYREGHKLDEWCWFVEILKKLPYVSELV